MHNQMLHEKSTTDFDAIRLAIASPETIMEWSHGEVTKPETINYRTQKPEKDGLFCEKIFGPATDFECHCGKYKGMHYRGIVCDRCGVLVTRSIVRRERMGHITLAVPVTHVWFLRGAPSSIGLTLDMTVKNLERVVYFANYAVVSVDEEKKNATLQALEDDVAAKKEAVKQRFEAMTDADEATLNELAERQTAEIQALDDEYTTKRDLLNLLVVRSLLNESQHRELRREYGDVYVAETGAKAILHILENIDLDKEITELTEQSEQAQGQRRKKLIKRLKMLEGMSRANLKPSWMILQHIPVLPPDLRPMVQLTGGRFATSDLNDLYRRVINRNNRLKKLLDMRAPEVICRNEMRMLQEAVDALIDNSHSRSGRAVSAVGGRRRLKSLTDMLRGKQGRFRQNLLGKRVDYSGRSVIVAGPTLEIDQCGLPKMMALELFKPYVIGKLIEREVAHNVKAASRLIERADSPVWDALDEVIQGKHVLLNRAPTLHRLGIQAFRPILIEGKAIQLHPLVCSGFNADFDGDQMAVHLPLSKEAQAEAAHIMSSKHNLLKPADGSIITNMSQDMILGAYYATYIPNSATKYEQPFSSVAEARFAYERGAVSMQTPIMVKMNGEMVETTIGRIEFNEILPEDFEYRNETFDKKQLANLLQEMFERYGEAVTAKASDALKNFGFEYATISGISTGMDDYHVPAQKDEIMQKGEDRAEKIDQQYAMGLITGDERARLVVENWRDRDEELLATLEEEFAKEENSTTVVVDSGARAKISAVRQISGMLGLMQDIYGNTIQLPIKSNYKVGLSTVDYFVSARGSRKVLIDTALKTADSGYLTRRMVDVAQDIFTYVDDDEDLGPGQLVNRSDCEAKGRDFSERVYGRCAAQNIKDSNGKTIVKAKQLITKELAQAIEAANIEEAYVLTVFDSPRVRGVNRLCYGMDLATGKIVEDRVPVGVIAAQAIGEPGTQLTLNTFHGGARAGGADITQGLPRVEELFEARSPKGESILSEVNGSLSVSHKEETTTVRILAEGANTERLPLEKRKPAVKDGQDVKAGEVLATMKDGSKPLAAGMDGTVQLHDDAIEIKPSEGVYEYSVPRYRQVMVADGETVTKGQPIVQGSHNLQDLLRLTDERVTQGYIMEQIQSIFELQGQAIADKHLEVIVRQMFSRVQIDDPGDSLFVTGDIVSKAVVVEQNQELADEKKQLITFMPVLLGITKISIWSDSFLSAASFQDTTRVLIGAATSGKVDNLFGLKENVIIGRQIPVGTGYHGVQSLTEVASDE